MSWKIVKIKSVLKQYRIEHWVQKDKLYKQVSIINDGSVILRGEKVGKEIGRKRQFIIDLDLYPQTLIFTRQLLLQGCIGMAPREVHGCIVTENMPMFSVEGILPEFLSYFLKSETFKCQVRKLETSGTAQKSLHERQFLELEVPLPSKREQISIVERLKMLQEKYMLLKEELNNQQCFLQLLRQAILQEAVQGKLTPQIETDEPASELLGRIKAEKQKLVKEGKLKREKELPPVREEEIPFELPKGWAWCRLGEVLNVKSSKRIHASDYKNDGVPFYRSMEIGLLGENKPIINELYISREKYEEVKKANGVPKPGDILIACIGGSIGNTWVVDEREFYYKDGNLVLIELIPNIDTTYLLNYLKSDFFMNSALERVLGSAYNALTIIKINNSLFPLPPSSVQKKISSKVNKVLRYISELETQVATNQEQAQKLLQAVLKETFGENSKEYINSEALTMAAEA